MLQKLSNLIKFAVYTFITIITKTLLLSTFLLPDVFMKDIFFVFFVHNLLMYFCVPIRKIKKTKSW